MSGSSKKVEFPGADGSALAARLDLPTGPVKAYALFAHCFTCSKDVFAATRISRGLNTHGIAVLRFDFTGLGASGGDFANTNFSSNGRDILAAASWLRNQHEAPALLIGHSLGGAAMLAAASDIPEAKAVATIGAPADPAHVVRHFSDHIEEIEEKGSAEVQIAGRRFTVAKQFLDDIGEVGLKDAIARLGKALLVFHAPRDEIVGIDNATRIFVAARHPKSFVSLDDADHLLTDRSDAIYVADVLAAWATRYLAGGGTRATPSVGEGEWLVQETDGSPYAQTATDGTHVLRADEPERVGGSNSGPDPYGFLVAALGACTSMTLRMYAERKNWPLEHVAVRLKHTKIHARDCAGCEETKGKIDHIERTIELKGDLSEEQQERLLEIADRCPVHQTLERRNEIVTRLGGN